MEGLELAAVPEHARGPRARRGPRAQAHRQHLEQRGVEERVALQVALELRPAGTAVAHPAMVRPPFVARVPRGAPRAPASL